MREQILKIQVDETAYKTTTQFSCKEVPFVSLSDNQPIKQMDFIIFTDGNGSETLRNMWELKESSIYYTDCLNTVHSDCFPLVVVLSHMYNSILHVRHGAYTDRKFFMAQFPLNMVKHELRIVNLCVELLCDMIDTKQFITKLKTLAAEDDDYAFESSVAIMESYPWDFRQNDQTLLSIDRICQVITKIRKCMEDKKQWRNIWQLAYGIHNEPAKIYEYQGVPSDFPE